MQEIKGTEINEVKKPEPENFKNIKPENGMDVEKTKVFWDNKFENREYEHNWEEFKYTKPEKSPDPAKWIEKGGDIKIEEKGRKVEWTYINSEGIEVKYVDGYPSFPEETKHPFIGDINIGSFTGDREKDKKLYKEKLSEEYGLAEIPTGYVVHHDTQNGNLQLIKHEYHEEFTHQGGHSKYKEGMN